jgi:YbbR domain-containing protein
LTYIKPTEHIAAKILSVLFACILWFHISSKAEYTYKVDIPVKYIEPSNGFIIASQIPSEAVIQVRGSGRKLFPYMMKRFSKKDGSYAIVSLVGLQKGRYQVSIDNNNIFIPANIGLNPDNFHSNVKIPVVIDKKIKRTIPVDSNSLPPFTVKDTCILVGKPKPKPEFVTAEGPEDILGDFHALRVKALDKNEISERDSLVPAILDTDSLMFVTINPKSVNIYFPVEPLETRLLSGIRVVLKNFPKKVRPRLEPDTLSVVVQGPKSVVSKLRGGDILVMVNYKIYRQHIARGDSIMEPLIFYPDDITTIRTIPEILHVTR